MRPCALVLAVAALGSSGCDEGTVEVVNEGGPGRDSDVVVLDGDAPDDAAPEAEAVEPGGTGPLTLIVSGVETVTERICDLDGDGLGDNAVADLGAAGATLMGAAFSAMLEGYVLGQNRVLLHFPRVADLANTHDPDTTWLILDGLDTDNPVDRDDDLSGDEPFWIPGSLIDECREPADPPQPAALENGELSATGIVRWSLGETEMLRLDGGRMSGTIDAEAGVSSITACGYATAANLARTPAHVLHLPTETESTLLEVFLAGGGALGVPGIDGLDFDVDVDGDGLEGVTLDASGRIETCIDGDNTEIPGPLCWQDERIADGISLTVQIELVTAHIADLAPPAGAVLLGACDEGPPSPSGWGSCPAPEEKTCDRSATRDCRDECDRPGLARCHWRCDGWAPCYTAADQTLRASSCDDLVLSNATCDGDSLEASLLAGPRQVGGLGLGQTVTIGRAPIIVDARLRAARGAATAPGDGWAVSAYLRPFSEWTAYSDALGVVPSLPGYSILWYFGGRLLEDEDGDAIFMMGHDGWQLHELFPADRRLVSVGENPLDPWTTDSVDQHLRLVIAPDDPDTAEDETAVGGFEVVGDTAFPLTMGCDRGTCPTRVSPGDEVTAAITGETGYDRDARLSVALPDGLTLRYGAPCP